MREATSEEVIRGNASKAGNWICISNEIVDTSYTVTWNSHKIRPDKHFTFRVRFFLSSMNSWSPLEDRYLYFECAR